MALATVPQRPSRLAIANINTAETLGLQYNPAELEEQLGVNYARVTVPGLSHQVMQFVYTENLVLTFDLTFDALSQMDQFDADDADNARRFLHALCYPQQGDGMRDIAPARTLFLWPNLFSLTTVITKLKIKHQRFSRNGQPTYFVASVTLEEIRDFRITSGEILADGTQRADSGGTEMFKLFGEK